MPPRVDIWGDRPLRAHETLLTEALAVAGSDPGRAARLLAEASIAASLAGQPALALATIGRAQAVASAADRTSQAIVTIDRAAVRLTQNRRRQPRRGIQAAIRQLASLEDEDVGASLYHSGVVLLWAEEYDASEAVLDRVVDAARLRQWPILAVVLDTLGALAYRTGRWELADGHSAEAVRLARRDVGTGFVLASALTTLARIAAARGREAECRMYLAEATELATPGGLADAYATTALGLLELGLGRSDTAIAALQHVELDGHAGFAPIVIGSGPDLVEAYVRSGRIREARSALARFEAALAGERSTWAHAAVARCRGLLAAGTEFDEPFNHALLLHAQTPTPFEAARTELCYGERLRRARRSAEASGHLTAARVAFQHLGAMTWAERATRELAPRRRSRSVSSAPASSLTPHELQITAFVRRGSTNREIASALFVSDKTVEYHLANVFRKLHVRSRTELALALERGDAKPS
jgi:ATP/maltotriose-dependent transcriptional regulator MalT